MKTEREETLRRALVKIEHVSRYRNDPGSYAYRFPATESDYEQQLKLIEQIAREALEVQP